MKQTLIALLLLSPLPALACSFQVNPPAEYVNGDPIHESDLPLTYEWGWGFDAPDENTVVIDHADTVTCEELGVPYNQIFQAGAVVVTQSEKRSVRSNVVEGSRATGVPKPATITFTP